MTRSPPSGTEPSALRAARAPRQSEGLEPVWLHRDGDRERNTGRLRLAAALVTASATLWLAVTMRGAWVWAVVLASTLACIYWLRSFLRTRTAPSGIDAIAADHAGFYRLRGAQSEFWDWSHIDEIELDEELGALRIQPRGAPALLLNECYGNMGLQQLEAWIEGHRRQCHNESGTSGDAE